MTQLETKKLFVRNLDWNLSEEQVHEFFAHFGEIASVKLPLDKFGRKRGFGFVEFMNEEDAQKAINETNEKTIGTSERPISVTLAEMREERPYGARREAHGDRGHHTHHDHANHDDMAMAA